METTSSANSLYMAGLRLGIWLEGVQTLWRGGSLLLASIHSGTGPINAITGRIWRRLSKPNGVQSGPEMGGVYRILSHSLFLICGSTVSFLAFQTPSSRMATSQNIAST